MSLTSYRAAPSRANSRALYLRPPLEGYNRLLTQICDFLAVPVSGGGGLFCTQGFPVTLESPKVEGREFHHLIKEKDREDPEH